MFQESTELVCLRKKMEKVLEWTKADIRHQSNDEIYQEDDRDYLMRQAERIVCQGEIKEILNK